MEPDATVEAILTSTSCIARRCDFGGPATSVGDGGNLPSLSRGPWLTMAERLMSSPRSFTC